MKIASITPSYNRSEKYRAMKQSFDNNTADNRRASVVLDVIMTDPDFKGYPVEDNRIVRAVDVATAWRWNDTAKRTDADIYILGSDDIEFATPGWDDRLRNLFAKYPDGILCVGFNDGREEGATPHYAVSKQWLEVLGYFANPIFFHWYVDTWTVDVAKRINRYVYASDILLKHNTCKLDGKFDETHKRIRRDGWNDRDRSVWESTERYREADATALMKHITEYHK